MSAQKDDAGLGRDNPALSALRHHVTGAIERGEAEPITEVPALCGLGPSCPTCNHADCKVREQHTQATRTEPMHFLGLFAYCPICGVSWKVT